MCEPTTLAAASLAIASASTIFSFVQQQGQADYTEDMARQNADAVRQDTVNQYDQLSFRRIQERDAAVEEKMGANLDALRARSTARASAGESGVSGLSVDALIADYYGQQGRYNDGVDRNYANTSFQIDQEMKGAQARGTTAIRNLPRGQRPSFIDAGLRIGGAALGAYGRYADASARQRLNEQGK